MGAYGFGYRPMSPLSEWVPLYWWRDWSCLCSIRIRDRCNPMRSEMLLPGGIPLHYMFPTNGYRLMARYLPLFLIFALASCDNGDKARPDQARADACGHWSGGLMLGTAQDDELLDVLLDGQGNVYLAGYEGGTIGKTTVDPSGNARGMVLQFNSQGKFVAKRIIDTEATDVVEALAHSPESNELFFVGRTTGAFPGSINQGQFDLVLGWSAMDAWHPRIAQFGDARPQHPRRLELGSANELVVAGFDDIFVPTNYVEAWENPMLTKFVRTGEQMTAVWQQRFDSQAADTFMGLAVARWTDGASYVTGYTSGGEKRGIAVAKFDTQGSELWYRQYTTIANDMGAALAVLQDGNLLLTGSTFAQLGAQSFGQMDVVVRKLDASTGEPLWTVQYGSQETDWVTDMAIDGQGNIYLVGETLGAIEPGRSNQGGFDVFLLKLDAEGRLLLTKQWGSAAYESPTAVAVDACQSVFVVGFTEGNLVGDSLGGRDGFIIPVATAENLFKVDPLYRVICVPDQTAHACL